MGVKVGDIVRVVSPGSSRNPGTVKAITPGISRGVEVEFTGTAWFYPYRSWFTESELVGALPEFHAINGTVAGKA